MVSKGRNVNKSLFTNEQLIGLLKIGVFLGMIATTTYYIVYVSIPDKVDAGLGKKMEEPLRRLATVEEKTRKLDDIQNRQVSMQEQLTVLSTQFEIYFGERPLTKKTAESTVEKSIVRLTNTDDPVQKTVSLSITNSVLDKAAAKNVVFDYKKVNQFGLALLTQNYQDDQKQLLKSAVAKLAKQRTLQSRAPKMPPEEETKIITNKEITLDATPYENVTFDNCTISYGAGWIGIKNVHFINCTFIVSPIDKGKELYEALFKSDEPLPSVTVTSGVPLPNSPHES